MSEGIPNFSQKMFPGALIQLGLVAIATFFVPAVREEPWIFGLLLGVIVCSSLIRLLITQVLQPRWPARDLRWGRQIYFLTLLAGASWGLMTAYDIGIHGITTGSLLLVVIILGNGSAALTSMFYDLKLIRVYISLILVPQFVVTLWLFVLHHNDTVLAYMLMSLLFYFFVWRESRLAHQIHWNNVRLRELAEARQAELERTRAIAMGAARMAALGEMASGIAHEINNPLTIIRGTTSLLQDQLRSGKADPAKLSVAMERIQGTVDRITRIVRGLLSFARENNREDLQSRPLKTIFEESLDLCRDRLYRKAIRFSVQTPEEGLLVLDRGTQVSQVLLNLLNNAIDAVKDQNEAWIRLETHPMPPFVEVWVTDSGPGIAPENREKIFQPFYTTKAAGEGTGLGLSISKGLIENLGGEIFYDGGCANTRFVLRLPLGGADS